MTLSDPNPGFKVTVYLEVECLKTVRFRDKVTKERGLPNGTTFNDLE